MIYPQVDLFRQRHVRAQMKARTSASTFGLVLMALFAFCCLGASAQNFQTYTMTTNGPLTVESGHFAPFTVTVTPTSNNVVGTISLYCLNLPAYASCEFPGANSGLPLNHAAATETITFNTSQVYNYETRSTPHHSTLGEVALCSLFAPAIGLLLFGRKRGVMGTGAMRLMVCVLALLPVAGLSGCGNTKPQATPAGSYTFTIYGAIGSTTENTNMTVNITQ